MVGTQSQVCAALKHTHTQLCVQQHSTFTVTVNKHDMLIPRGNEYPIGFIMMPFSVFRLYDTPYFESQRA